MRFKDVLLRALVIAALASWAGVVCAQFFPRQASLKPSSADSSTVAVPSDPGSSAEEGAATASGAPEKDPAAENNTSAASPDDPQVEIDWSQTHFTIEQARVIYDQGLADFVDARSDEEYDAGHIRGAFHVSQADFASGNFTPAILEFLQDVPHDRPLVIYCEGGSCDTSENVAIRLQEMGFTRLYIMTDGYPGWVKAQLPTETSENTDDSPPLPAEG